MPLVATRGAASAQGFGEFAQSAAPVYIEDVMSVYLYTGNGSTQTITNGIDLSTKGGLVWIKGRSVAYSHAVFDTARGATNRLVTNATDANSVETGTLTAFNSTGFALGSTGAVNNNGTTFASWTFRKQPKFFDVVTYTGNGSSVTTNHSLGAAPGVIIVKATSTSGLYWIVYHRSLSGQYLEFNTTSAAITNASAFTSVTSTSFTVGNGLSSLNQNGETYVAYLFAHNAGGFGLSGADNVISCGSFTASSGAATVTLGYEPQWVLYKRTDDTDNWKITDNMRGMFAPGGSNGFLLYPNLSNAEAQAAGAPYATATGFSFDGVNNGPGSTSGTYIYIAIRRGPMKTPTSGTSVFAPTTTSDDGNAITTGFPVDMFMEGLRAGNSINQAIMDRLRGDGSVLTTSSTAAQNPVGEGGFASNTTIKPGLFGGGSPAIIWNFRRAPGFFDVVCYTGTGSATTFSHNLGVVPELMIAKCRNDTGQWAVYSSSLPASNFLFLNSTAASATNTAVWNATAPTSSVFSVGTSLNTNSSGFTFVAYLFATCPGVSKVGSYTGTGTTLQIDCGFTGGARFVLIKRTDSTGDWYVWDSARGIVAGNDPYLLLNSTAAEVTNTDYVDTYSAGFEISSTAPAAINANGGTFIFLAIA